MICSDRDRGGSETVLAGCVLAGPVVAGPGVAGPVGVLTMSGPSVVVGDIDRSVAGSADWSVTGLLQADTIVNNTIANNTLANNTLANMDTAATDTAVLYMAIRPVGRYVIAGPRM